jgi:PAS domain S-box-containing protein
MELGETALDHNHPTELKTLRFRVRELESRESAWAKAEDAAIRLAALVQSADDAIVGKTINGIVETWNPGAERLYGYSADDMVGRDMTILLPPDRPDEEAYILDRISRGERVDHFDTVRKQKDGNLVNVSIAISPIIGKNGSVIGASHVARDISSGAELELARARLASIVESSDDAIVSKDLAGIVQTWNKGAVRIYGYPASEMIGRPMSTLLPPDRPDEETQILRRLAKGERVDHFETARMRKDGSRIDVSLSISPIYDKDGCVIAASHVARDITERRSLETQRLHAQKLESLGVLAGGIAHDFNNLLTGILGNASLVLEDFAATNPNRHVLAECVKAAERASQLTKQLLAYAGKGRFVTEAVNLSVLVREITALIQASISRKVQIRLELGRELPPIDADAGQLQQVIMNLIINGAEAIGENIGLVVCTTTVQTVDEAYLRTLGSEADYIAPGQYVILEVHDNGSGMDETTLTRIFEPFFTTKFTGRGLGLAAVSGIVHGHKGALKVYSSPGKGSTFKVLFPALLPTDATAAPEPPLSLTDGRDKTVLIVDDEEVVRSVARNTLQRRGYRTIEAADGREAIEVYRRLGSDSPNALRAVRLLLCVYLRSSHGIRLGMDRSVLISLSPCGGERSPKIALARAARHLRICGARPPYTKSARSSPAPSPQLYSVVGLVLKTCEMAIYRRGSWRIRGSRPCAPIYSWTARQRSEKLHRREDCSVTPWKSKNLVLMRSG